MLVEGGRRKGVENDDVILALTEPVYSEGNPPLRIHNTITVRQRRQNLDNDKLRYRNRKSIHHYIRGNVAPL